MDLNFVFSWLQQVERGTNGGVTKEGVIAAMAAGYGIGITFAFAGLLTANCTVDVGLKQIWVVPFCIGAGLCGSLIRSLLGAAFQFSGFCRVSERVSISSRILSKLHQFVTLFFYIHLSFEINACLLN